VADYLPPVVAKLTGDDSGLTRTLAASKDKVKRWAVDVGKTKVTLAVDLKLKDGALAAVRTKVKDAPAARMQVKLDLATGAKAALAQKLKQGSDVEVRVKPKMDQTAQRRVALILDELGKRIDVTIRPTMDRTTQLSVQARLDRLSRDRTVTIRTRTIGGGSAAAGAAASGSGALGALISLAPALAPIAASAVSVAASLASATVAVGVFGLAVAPQIAQLGAAATAQTAYNKAVAKYGPNSQQATTAQVTLNQSLDGMPPATRAASAALADLKGTFKAWSNQLAGFTMDPVTRSFAVVEGILPKLTPLVKGTSTELDRLVTLAGGAVASPGFDSMMSKFTAFANGALKNLVDDVVHFSRVLSEGSANGAVQKFMDYAKQQGPAVGETLKNVAKAISTILQGSAEAGPGMLTLVNALAKLVAALPPAFVGRVLQVLAAFKLYKLASTGITSVSGSVTTLSGRLTALRAASAAAGGGVAGVRAALASLSAGTKAAGALLVIGGLAYAAYKLSSASKESRVSIDDLSRSIEKGLASGRIASPVIDDLRKAEQGLVKDTDASASAWDKIGYSLSHWGAKWSSTASSTQAMANDQRDLGKALGQLAQNKGADTATQALKLLNAEGVKIPTKYLKDYTNAVADNAFEQKLAANSMGMFGDQAQHVQKQLDAQKQAAQGLQQAILDLNDANRAALDAESAYQQSIDDATAGIAKHEHALKMANGQLDLNSGAARTAYGNLSQLAANAEAASVATLQQTGSQDKANRVLIDAHTRLVNTAHAMGLNSQDANKLADSLDNIRDPKIQVTVNTMAAEANLASAKKKVQSFPKSAKTTGNFEYQKALSDLQFYQRAIDRLHGKTVTVTVNGKGLDVNASTYYQAGPHAYGGVIRKFAGGGTVPGYAPMRDTVQALLSPGEGVLVPEAVRRMGGEAGINSINRQARGSGAGQAAMAGLQQGMSGAPALGAWVGQGLTQGLASSLASIVATTAGMGRAVIGTFSKELGIASPSKKFKALGSYVISGLVQGLTGSTSAVKTATKKIATDLSTDFGKSHKGLQKWVAQENAELLKLAANRDTVASKLKAAQTKLAALETSWQNEKSSVASSIKQSTSLITTSPQAGATLTGQDVLNNLKAEASAAAQFGAQLQTLKKKGLSASLIDQIAQAGVDQGGATAAALASASSDTIKQINATQKGITTSANAAGTSVANAMYGAGVASAKGLVKGLQSQEKAIDNQMLKIAKSMQSAIKKALGIKSPSTVMAQLGDHTARGYAVGIDRSAKHAVIAARGMAMAVRQGASMGGSLTGALSGSAGGVSGSVTGGGTYIQHVHVTVEGSVVTEKKLIDAIEAGLSRRALSNPGGFRPVLPAGRSLR
jgi:hypothetical protein